MQPESDFAFSASFALAVGLAIAAVVYVWKLITGAGIIVPEGVRGVMYKDGKFVREVGPGRYWIFPRSTLRTVNVNEITITVPSQEVLSQDRLALRMSAVATIRIRDARKALETSIRGILQRHLSRPAAGVARPCGGIVA